MRKDTRRRARIRMRGTMQRTSERRNILAGSAYWSTSNLGADWFSDCRNCRGDLRRRKQNWAELTTLIQKGTLGLDESSFVVHRTHGHRIPSTVVAVARRMNSQRGCVATSNAIPSGNLGHPILVTLGPLLTFHKGIITAADYIATL
jgi:hypothetical protein